MARWIIDKKGYETERDKRGWNNADVTEHAKVYGVSISDSTISNCYSPHIGCSQKYAFAVCTALGFRPWWKGLIKEHQEIFADTEPLAGTEFVPVIMSHRSEEIGDEYYRKALASGRDVIYVSIMSEHSFPYFEEWLNPETKVSVLTWNPETTNEIRAFETHINEAGDHVKQTRNALDMWDRVAKSNGNVKIFTYRSTPTLQGVVVMGGWAKVELMTYATPTQLRSAILLRESEASERRMFRFMAGAFADLLKSAKKRDPGDPPDWERPTSP